MDYELLFLEISPNLTWYYPLFISNKNFYCVYIIQWLKDTPFDYMKVYTQKEKETFETNYLIIRYLGTYNFSKSDEMFYNLLKNLNDLYLNYPIDCEDGVGYTLCNLGIHLSDKQRTIQIPKKDINTKEELQKLTWKGIKRIISTTLAGTKLYPKLKHFILPSLQDENKIFEDDNNWYITWTV